MESGLELREWFVYIFWTWFRVFSFVIECPSFCEPCTLFFLQKCRANLFYLETHSSHYGWCSWGEGSYHFAGQLYLGFPQLWVVCRELRPLLTSGRPHCRVGMEDGGKGKGWQAHLQRVVLFTSSARCWGDSKVLKLVSFAELNKTKWSYYVDGVMCVWESKHYVFGVL